LFVRNSNADEKIAVKSNVIALALDPKKNSSFSVWPVEPNQKEVSFQDIDIAGKIAGSTTGQVLLDSESVSFKSEAKDLV
jgi:hypothetical protein